MCFLKKLSHYNLVSHNNELQAQTYQRPDMSGSHIYKCVFGPQTEIVMLWMCWCKAHGASLKKLEKCLFVFFSSWILFMDVNQVTGTGARLEPFVVAEVLPGPCSLQGNVLFVQPKRRLM